MSELEVTQRAQEELRKSVLELEKQRIKDLRSIMAESTGRRFVFDLLSSCNIYNVGINLENVNHTYFIGGQRSIGLKLVDRIQEACPDLYDAMIRESRALKAKEK